MKWRMPSVAEGFRGGARIVGGRGPTLQGHGSRPCVSRNVTGLRGTRGSPVGVSCSRRAPHITACNRFRIPVNGRHNLRNVFSCGSVCDGATHPKRMEGKESFNDWGGRGYDDFVPGVVTKTATSEGRTERSSI